jgi:hypothetical protein
MSKGGDIVDRIIQQLKEPSWWFTAFFVAIIASLLAGFLKDALTRWMAGAFGWYGKRKESSLALREYSLEFLTTDPIFATLYSVRLILKSLALLFCLGMFTAIPVWADLTLSSPSFYNWVWTGLSRQHATVFAKIQFVSLGVVSVLLCFITASDWALFLKAYVHRFSRLVQGKRALVSGSPGSKTHDERLNP